MSSISFPNPHRSSGSHEEQFYTPEFDTTSFQMNPLSSHPPRTPRTSIVANSSNTYPNGHYQNLDADNQEKVDVEDIEIDEEEEKIKSTERKIKKEEVWREIFLTSAGRDKAFKLIQYSIRLGLAFHLSLTTSRLLRRPTQSPLELDILRRLQSTASGLSFTRKLLLLFNWLGPLTAILEQQTVPFSSEQSAEKAKKNAKAFLAYPALCASACSTGPS
jgi:hypothetical protein